ncbi:rhodanese-like domain-containing protein [Sphingobium aquiterrae]|uniref:rhodanese-like domain-containing protein n=1 Tax=Sphingobium aquiterrae TaxID=2038656 RepID=UPI003018B6DF
MRAWAWIAATLLSLCAATAGQAQDGEPLFDPDGYRIAHYRAPVIRPPDGVGRIAPNAAAMLRPDRDALFIDVTPAEGGHREADGRWRLARARATIPGAHWFPEAGRGVPAPDIATWFAKGIARLSRGRRDRMIVTFCLADCWMSWNAAKRLRAMGYSRVWWMAEGSDGWADLGLALTPAIPER